MPYYIANKLSEIMPGVAIVSLIITVFYVQFLCFNAIGQVEDKYKGKMVLCSCPYTRKSLVYSEYIFYIGAFLICLLIYFLCSLINIFNLDHLCITDINLALLITNIWFCIFVPLQHRFGYGSIKFFTMITLIGLTFLLPYSVKNLSKINNWVNLFDGLNIILKNLIIVITTIIITFSSVNIAKKIFFNKDL